MQHYNQGYDELYHYGVMGMKWGKSRINRIDSRIARNNSNNKEAIDEFTSLIKKGGIKDKKGRVMYDERELDSIMKEGTDITNSKNAKLQVKKNNIQRKIDDYVSNTNKQRAKDNIVDDYDQDRYMKDLQIVGTLGTKGISNAMKKGMSYKTARNVEVGKQLAAGLLIGAAVGKAYNELSKRGF